MREMLGVLNMVVDDENMMFVILVVFMVLRIIWVFLMFCV